MTDTSSEFIRHAPCPHCGSSDAYSLYTDGHGWCFACNTHDRGDGAPEGTKRKRMASTDLIQGREFAALGKRRITEETARKFSYHLAEYKGKPVQVADYYDPRGEGVVAQKVRFADKTFVALGNMKAAGLYGQHLWRDGGKMVVVTEGEIDALSVSQLQNNKWPVVSVPNGAQGAKKAIQKSLDWLQGFQSVVFMFDNDEQGRAAALECAEVLPPGKAKIASLPLKDASDMLMAGRGGEVIDAIWGAKSFRPDGIVSGAEMWDALAKEDAVTSIPYPYTGLTDKTAGLRQGELVTVTAGSGIGKSLLCREIAHYLVKEKQETVGYIALEESVKRTALGFLSMELGKPLHISRADVTEEQLKAAFDATLGTGRVFLYDHFGSTDSDNLMARIRYLAKGCGCKWIVLDHISIVVSGIEDGDERRTIDNTMTKLRTLVEETGVGMLLVSHLKRPEGKGHEEGAITSLSQLRGSAAIGQLSDIVIGLERDQQDEDEANKTTVRILKNRFTGETGVAGTLVYNKETGRLREETAFDEDTAF
jgi:twinkle protein